MGGDKAGSASRATHSTDRIVANRPNIAATADTADIDHPNMGCSRGHMPVPGDQGRPRRAEQKVKLPKTTLSSDCPPLKDQGIDAEKSNSKTYAVKLKAGLIRISIRNSNTC
jgi:hypothetical protein